MVTTQELPSGFEAILQVYSFMAHYYNRGRLKSKLGALKLRSCDRMKEAISHTHCNDCTQQIPS